MDLEHLISLVNKLSKGQKRQLTQYLSFSKRNLELLLYRRISKYLVLGEEKVPAIRGGEFSDSGVFYQYRRRLAESIIRIRVAPKKGSVPPIEFIRDAYLVKGDVVGYKMLNDKMKEAQSNEHFGSLQSYFDLIQELALYHNISIDCPPGIWTQIQFERIRLNHKFLLNAIARIRNSFSEKEGKKLQIALELEAEIPQDLIAKTNQNLKLKMLSGLAILRNDIDEAFRIGEKFVEEIKSWPSKYPNSSVAKEMRVLALDSVYLGFRNLAMKYYFELSAIPPFNDHEKDEILKSRIIVGVYIAERYETPLVAKETFALIKSNPSIFDSRLRDILIYSLGLAHFYNLDFSKAIECLSIVRQIDKSSKTRVSWEPILLKAICHFELGTDGIMGHFIDSLNSIMEHCDTEYPPTAISYFKKLVNSSSQDHRMLLNSGIKKLENLVEDPTEERAALLFPVHLWFISKASLIPIRETISEKRSTTKIRTRVVGES